MLEEHIKRLYKSAHSIALKINMSRKSMERAVIETCKANSTKNGYIRVVATRGVGKLGLNPFSCHNGQIIIIAANIQLYPEEFYDKGMKVITSATIRNHPEALNPNIKSLNYLNNILAKIEAINGGVEEVIMLNHQGYVSEASGDNIFIITENVLHTPPVSAGILEGISRNIVMDLALDTGLNVKETVLTRNELYNADEMFLTGTAAEIISVVEMDSRKIGTGKPGPKTRKLREKFHTLTKNSGTLIK
jgi:branched-chain amino acid aminotransferase